MQYSAWLSSFLLASLLVPCAKREDDKSGAESANATGLFPFRLDDLVTAATPQALRMLPAVEISTSWIPRVQTTLFDASSGELHVMATAFDQVLSDILAGTLKYFGATINYQEYANSTGSGNTTLGEVGNPNIGACDINFGPNIANELIDNQFGGSTSLH